MKKNIITIAGKLGSGKSSTGKKIAQQLLYQHFSSGDFYRNVAAQRGVTITELNEIAKKEPEIDYEIDDLLKKKAFDKDLVIDSRLAFHWIPDSFKVYLEIDSRLAAKRMVADLDINLQRKKSEKLLTIDEMVIDSQKRLDSEIQRYKKLYDVNHTEHAHFDYIINTGLPENNLESVVEKIKKAYLQWLKN
jgi:cytidylate kinase